MRNVSDLFYVELFDSFAASHPNFEPTIVLSQPDPERWSGLRGRVTHLIEERLTQADGARSEAYIAAAGR